MALGALPGVVNTRAGWLDGKEIVEVSFDPKVTSYEKLAAQSRCVQKPATIYVHNRKHLAAAKKAAGNDVVVVGKQHVVKDAKASDRKYYLRKSPSWHLPLTALQAVRVNVALKQGTDPRHHLSPRQVGLLKRIVAASKKQKEALQKLSPARKPEAFAGYIAQVERLLAQER